MKNCQSKKIKKAANQLKQHFNKKYGFRPYTLYITAWDDGDFAIILSSTIFLNGLQEHEVIKSESPIKVIQLTWRHRQITENVIEKTHKSHF